MSKLKQARKALAAAVLPVVTALVMWASTGTLDATELSVGISGLVAALIVYLVPNETTGRAPDHRNG